ASAAVAAHARGDSAGARAAIVELEEVTRDRPDWIRLLHAAPMLRICVEIGELELGERLLDRPGAQGLRQEHALVAGRAISAEARGRTADAATLYADAAARWHEYESPFEEAHALLGHWRCTGREEGLREAQRLFAQLGAVVPQAT